MYLFIPHFTYTQKITMKVDRSEKLIEDISHHLSRVNSNVKVETSVWLVLDQKRMHQPIWIILVRKNS